MLLVVAALPQRPDAIAMVAAAVGMEPADVRQRLAGTLPRVLTSSPDAARIAALTSALDALGVIAVSCDPATAPGDDARLVARELTFAPEAFSIVDRAGGTHIVPTTDVSLILRGVSVTRTSTETVTKGRKFDVGRAVLTGGLMMTKKVETKTVENTETTEGFVVLGRSDGDPSVILYERRLDYRFLGAEKQPSSHANLEQITRKLRTLLPHAVFDDRLLRSGFLNGLPVAAEYRLDLGIHLLALAHGRMRELGRTL